MERVYQKLVRDNIPDIKSFLTKNLISLLEIRFYFNITNKLYLFLQHF